MKKRIISLLLAITIVFSMVPSMTYEADAIVGSVLKAGFTICKSVISGSITTAKNVDYYDGNIGKCVLGQFKNIAADLTGLDIGENYGDDNVVEEVTLDDIKTQMNDIRSELEKQNETIYQLESTVSTGLNTISKQLDEIKNTVTTEANITRYYTYLTEFFSFFNQYYEGISYYDNQLDYALSGNRSSAYIKNIFDQFYHLENVEYTGNLHSSVEKLGKYLRGEYASTESQSVVDVLSRYYILSYKAKGKTETEAQKLAAQDTEAMIGYIYYAYCMGVYYEEAVSMYQSVYMADQGSDEYQTDFGTWITTAYLTDQVKALGSSTQETAGAILGSLLAVYPTEKFVLNYHTLFTLDDDDRDEYWYTRTVSFDDGFKMANKSGAYFPDPATVLYSGFSDELKSALTDLAVFSVETNDASHMWFTGVYHLLSQRDTAGTVKMYICVGDKIYKTSQITTFNSPCTDGDGTEDYPYLITELSQLHNMDNSSAHFVLGREINGGNSNFSPITGFKGTLDGNGHTISNVNLHFMVRHKETNAGGTTEEIQSIGLFANLYGTVKNVTLSGITIQYSDGHNFIPIMGDWGDSFYAGALAGYVAGGTISRCCVKDSDVALSEISTSGDAQTDTDLYAGAVAGGVFAGGTIESCINTDTKVTARAVNSFTANVGGIAGAVGRDGTFNVGSKTYQDGKNSGTVKNCAVVNETEGVLFTVSDGKYSAEDSNSSKEYSRVGGFVGALYCGTLDSGIIKTDCDPFSCCTYDPDFWGYSLSYAGKTAGYVAPNYNLWDTLDCVRGKYAVVCDASWSAGDTGLIFAYTKATVTKYTNAAWENGEVDKYLGSVLSEFELRNDKPVILDYRFRIEEPTQISYLKKEECANLAGMKVYSADGKSYAKGYQCYCSYDRDNLYLYGNVMERSVEITIVSDIVGPNASDTLFTILLKCYDDHIYYQSVVPATCTEAGSSKLICADCGEVKNQTVIPALGHKEVVDEAVSATCNADGLTEGKHCERCGEILVKQDVVKSTGDHGHTIVKGYAATCTTDGLTDKDYCEGCGLVHTEATVIKATGHDWETITVLNPTCTASGMTQQKCKTCGAYGDFESVTPTGHDYKETVTAATCTTPGYTVHTCNTCGDSYTDNYTAPTGHSYDDGTVTKAATCTEEGEMTYKCSCGDTHTEPIPKIAHTYKETVVDPTCEDMGYTEHKCACGESYRDNYTAPTGHVYDDGTVTKEATCTQEGEMTYTCSCGDTHTEPIAKLAHEYKETVVAPTCEDMGYTEHKCACGESYKDNYTAPTGHTYDDGTVTKAATCTEDGEMTYKCTCGQTETAVIPKLDHDWDEGTITLAPSITAEGKLEQHCSRCAEVQTSVLPKLEGCDDKNCPSDRFTDVQERTNWSHAGIDYMLQLGLFKGMSQTTFEPDTAVTRAMLVTVLYRYEGQPEISGNGGFTDVSTGRYYSDAVAWASENGIVLGMGDGTFDPEGEITRQQIAVILYRYAQFKGVDVSVDENTDLTGYQDAAEVNRYAVTAMTWATQTGMINGVPVQGSMYLQPRESATRAQVCTILMRYIKNCMG